MAERDKLPAKTVIGHVVPSTERSSSLVARGLEAISRNGQVLKTDVPEQRADARKEPYLFAVSLWFTVTTARVLKHRGLANRAEALERTVPAWMSQPSTADERRMRWEMFNHAKRIMTRPEEGLAKMIEGQLNKVSEQLNDEAQFHLGEAHHYGDGVSQSDGWAIYWWRKAAEQGSGDAQYYLGCAYSNGEGRRKDYVQAHMWFSLSCDHLGRVFYNPSPEEQIESLESEMNPVQIAEAQRLAREWLDSHAS